MTKQEQYKRLKEQIETLTGRKVRLVESNEMRGCYHYEYDFKTGKLKKTGSSVESELAIGVDEVFMYYHNQKRVKQLFANKGKIQFFEYPSESEREIIGKIKQYLKEMGLTESVVKIGEGKDDELKKAKSALEKALTERDKATKDYAENKVGARNSMSSWNDEVDRLLTKIRKLSGV